MRPYEYRAGRTRRAALEAKLEALRRAGGRRELLVPESAELGGFGHEIDGALYNIDTLKYFEVLIALERGAAARRAAARRAGKIVWEIGAGWGGLRVRVQDAVSRTSPT